ncbi:SRPBCC domain-containing protein [Mycobacterium sp. 236(2023)]|uniref:SRPBCC domain-containing protein n=1 Tax=Mycobacterium sp. 236(2023) TaxID=3038163 RepID=UPI0024153166|nr:SRPBCC domain-containing protein [Mycobacterium sp. 236(2023)]MDG4669285.1 SRPBCC domain-containing protein [Mycobacterium sp. 236(2023)]
MQVKNEFVIDADVDQAWSLLIVALERYDGPGTLTVRIGPVTAALRGSVRVTRKVDATRHAILTATGEGSDGQATAKVHVRLESITRAQTRVLIDTDLEISGRIAQFGRGAIADAGSRLISRFAADIARHVTTPPAAVLTAPTAPTVPAGPVVTDRYRQALLGALLGFLLSWLAFGRRAGGRRYIVLYPQWNPVEDQRITREWGRGSR